MSDYKKDSDDAKKKSGKTGKTKKIKEPSLEEQLLSVGLKLDPIEKSSKLKNKSRKQVMQNRKMGCNGKVMPSKKELEKMFQDNSNEVEEEVAMEPTPVIDVNAIVEKAVGALFNDGEHEQDFFGTSALNYDDKVESVSRDKLPCIFRYLNPREEPLPERTLKKCSIGKEAKNFRRGPGEPCTCEKGIACKKRKHKRIKLSQDEETRPPNELKLKFFRDSDGYKIINDDADSSQIVLKEEAMMPLAESSPKRRAFSPLPSTSHDNATFEMNDRNYYQSLGVDDSFSEMPILAMNEIVVNKTEPVEVDEPVTVEATSDEPRQTVDELLEIIDVDDSNDDQDCVVVDVDAILAENRSVLDGIRRKRERAVPKISSEIVTLEDSQNDDVIHIDEGPSTLRSISRLLHDGLTEIRSLLRGSDSSTSPETRTRRRRLGVEVVATVDLTSTLPTPPTDTPFHPSPDSQTILDLLSWCDPFLELPPSTPPPTHSPLAYPPQLPVYPPQPPAYPPQPPAYPPQPPAYPPPPLAYPQAPTPSHRSGLGECPICLETLTSPMSTLCGHVFCRDCLANIMKNDKRCSVCRKAIKKNGFHPIYF